MLLPNILICSSGLENEKMKKLSVFKECVIALGIVINVLGAFIAMTLRLPVYLDSVGTICISAFFGPIPGMICGVLGSLLSGALFDVYSFYYAPVQLLTGLCAGLLFRTRWLSGRRLPLGTLGVALPTAISSAVITAFVFGGLTSSGSSYIVQLLTKLGAPLTFSCFIVQILTDYADELIGVCIVTFVMAVMPREMLRQLKGERHGAIQ